MNYFIRVTLTVMFGLLIALYEIQHKRIGCLEDNKVLDGWQCVSKSIDLSPKLQ